MSPYFIAQWAWVRSQAAARISLKNFLLDIAFLIFSDIDMAEHVSCLSRLSKP